MGSFGPKSSDPLNSNKELPAQQTHQPQLNASETVFGNSINDIDSFATLKDKYLASTSTKNHGNTIQLADKSSSSDIAIAEDPEGTAVGVVKTEPLLNNFDDNAVVPLPDNDKNSSSQKPIANDSKETIVENATTEPRLDNSDDNAEVLLPDNEQSKSSHETIADDSEETATPTIQNSNAPPRSSSPHSHFSPHSPKRARLEKAKIDKVWYSSVEESIAQLTNATMKRVNQCNAESLSYIERIENESCELRDTIERLKGEKLQYKRKIELLEMENGKLRKNAKICRACGQKVNTMLFCMTTAKTA